MAYGHLLSELTKSVPFKIVRAYELVARLLFASLVTSLEFVVASECRLSATAPTF